MGRLIALLLIVFYIYGVVGMELFHGALKKKPSDYDPENFDTFLNAMLALFQISTTNNWNDVMFSLIHSFSSSFYFVSFFFIVCIIMVNILTSFVIDTYSTYIEKEHGADKEMVVISASPVQSPVNSPRSSLSLALSLDLDEKNQGRPLSVPAEKPTSGTWHVYKTQLWTRQLVQERIPEMRQRELEALKQKVHHLSVRLQQRGSMANMGGPRLATTPPPSAVADRALSTDNLFAQPVRSASAAAADGNDSKSDD